MKRKPRVRSLLIAIAWVAVCGGVLGAQTAEDWVTRWTGSLPYPNQHGEAGHPGVVPGHKVFGRRWGYAERIPYPGSVEHWRGEANSYFPPVPRFNAKTLIRNFRATELPGVAADRVMDYAEPVYCVHNHPKDGKEAVDTGLRNAPVKVVQWDQGHPPVVLDLGELPQSTYVVRVIAATPTENVQQDVKRLVINMEVNDGPAGRDEITLYRKRTAAVDEFYSVLEMFFHAPAKRAYTAKLWIDKSSKLPLLVYNFDLHDVLGQVAARSAKRSPSLYDPEAREAVWRSKGVVPVKEYKTLSWRYRIARWRRLGPAPETREGRLKRDEAIWRQMPPINAQVSTSGASSYGSYSYAPKLPAPEGAEERLAADDGLGVDFYDTPAAKAKGVRRQTHYPVASGRMGDLRRQFQTSISLAEVYHNTGNELAGRDGAVYLASVAWKIATEGSRQNMQMIDMVPWMGYPKDHAFRKRFRVMHYPLRNEWPFLFEAYDRLFTVIQGNEELTESVGRLVPWVKTPDDLVRFFDTYILQYNAHLIMTYNLWLRFQTPAWLAQIAAVQQDAEIAKPWLNWLFKYSFVYPNPLVGADELATSFIQRDGTNKEGSWFYVSGGNFTTELCGNLAAYRRLGGTLPVDMTDISRFPKTVSMCYFPIEARLAGGYQFPHGCVGSPLPPRYKGWMWSGEERLVRLGWDYTRDSRFAFLIKHYLGRVLESDEEWTAIETAAKGVRHPLFAQGSRVLSDWLAVLETGAESDDFRFRRAVGMSVGEIGSYPLALQVYAHGVPLSVDTGMRQGYMRPCSGKMETGNTVISSLVTPRSRRWVTSFTDTRGARYMAGRVATAPGTVYARQVALVDVDEGKPSAQPLPLDGPKAKLPSDVITPSSYVVDVFRVRGGKAAPAYAFHGPPADAFSHNELGREQPPRQEPDILKIFTDKASTWRGKAPDVFTATWRLRRDKETYQGKPLSLTEAVSLGPNYDPKAPRKFIRLHLPGHAGAAVMGGRQVPRKAFYFTLEHLYVQPSDGATNTVFPAIIEPFAGEPFVESVRLLIPEQATANAGAAVVFEVALKNGRRDIVYVAPRDSKPTTVENVGTFQGEFACVSMDEQGVRQAVLVGGTRLEAKGVFIKSERSAYEGVIESVDYLAKKARLTVSLPKSAAGAVIEIGPAARRTSFTVQSVAEKSVTFRKGMELGASRIRGFTKEGYAVTNLRIAVPGLPVTTEDLACTWRMNPESRNDTLQLTDGPDPKGKLRVGDMLRVWEFGPGDTVRLPVHVNLRRTADGKYEVDANVAATVTVGGKSVLTAPAAK